MALNVGDTYKLVLQFKALDNDELPEKVYYEADPSTIAVTVTPPSGDPVVYTLAGGGVVAVAGKVGVYRVDVPITAAGRWTARVVSTGEAAGEDEFAWKAVA